MRILCVTTVKNEAPFLLEWIAHHRGAGITDFLIYSNDCTDGTDAMLQTLDQAGVVTHVPQTVEAKKSPQWQALRAAWKHPLRKACDWALVSDVDEFINIHTGNHTFADLITALPQNAEAITLPWRLFGNNGIPFFQDTPVTEQLTHSAPVECPYPIAATLFKSLVRTDGRFNQFGVHRPGQKNPEKHGVPIWVNGDGIALPAIFSTNDKRLSMLGLPNGRTLVECNHYSLKSAESFLIKRDRGLPNRSQKSLDLTYWVERNFNTVPNTSIAAMSPATAKARAKLSTIPDIDAQHTAAVRWHHERFKTLITQPNEHALFSQLMITGNSQTPPIAITKQLLAWYQATQKNIR